MFASRPRRRHCALLVVAVAVAGCGSKSDPQAGPSSSSTASPQAAKRQPASPEEYQAALDAAADGVKRALKAVREASTVNGLGDRLERSETTLTDAADKLEGMKAPADAEPGRADAVKALRAFAAGFSAAAEDVTKGAVCTAPAAVAQITRSRAAQQLRTAAAQLKKDGFPAAGLATRRAPTPAVRLKNGAILARKGGTGPGQLVIRNGNDREGVVRIIAGDTRVTAYVARQGTATIPQIADGSYRVYFATGSSWDGRRNTFSRKCAFTGFDDKMKFTSGGGQYTRFTITLNPVADGTAATSPIGADAFPRG